MFDQMSDVRKIKQAGVQIVRLINLEMHTREKKTIPLTATKMLLEWCNRLSAAAVVFSDFTRVKATSVYPFHEHRMSGRKIYELRPAVKGWCSESFNETQILSHFIYHICVRSSFALSTLQVAAKRYHLTRSSYSREREVEHEYFTHNGVNAC